MKWVDETEWMGLDGMGVQIPLLILCLSIPPSSLSVGFEPQHFHHCFWRSEIMLILRIGIRILVILYVAFLLHLFINWETGSSNEYYTEPTPSLVETDVLIIGSGIAGLTAASTLRENGVKFKILEASGQIGGRLQKTHQFGVGFDLGPTLVYEPAWPNIIAGKPVNLTAMRFSSRKLPSYGLWVHENYTWNDFIVDHMQPEPGELVNHCFVESVSYEGKPNTDNKAEEDNLITAVCGRQTFYAKHIIVTSPLNVLKSGDMKFDPPLPKSLVQDHPATVADGIKVLLEFKWPFPPKYMDMGWYQPKDPPGGVTKFYGSDLLQPHSRKYVIVGDILGSHATQYYDMTNTQNGNHLLTLTKKNSLLPNAQGWNAWTETNFTNHLLQILDKQMQNYFLQTDMASANLIKMQLIYWNKIKSIRGGSIQPFDCAPKKEEIYDDDQAYNPAKADKPKICHGTQLIDGKLILAGEAFPYIVNPEEIGWVHNAALSGRYAAGQVLTELLPNGDEIAAKLKLPTKTNWQSPWLNPKLKKDWTKEEIIEAAKGAAAICCQ